MAQALSMTEAKQQVDIALDAVIGDSVGFIRAMRGRNLDNLEEVTEGVRQFLSQKGFPIVEELLPNFSAAAMEMIRKNPKLAEELRHYAAQPDAEMQAKFTHYNIKTQLLHDIAADPQSEQAQEVAQLARAVGLDPQNPKNQEMIADTLADIAVQIVSTEDGAIPLFQKYGVRTDDLQQMQEDTRRKMQEGGRTCGKQMEGLEQKKTSRFLLSLGVAVATAVASGILLFKKKPSMFGLQKSWARGAVYTAGAGVAGGAVGVLATEMTMRPLFNQENKLRTEIRKLGNEVQVNNDQEQTILKERIMQLATHMLQERVQEQTRRSEPIVARSPSPEGQRSDELPPHSAPSQHPPRSGTAEHASDSPPSPKQGATPTDSIAPRDLMQRVARPLSGYSQNVLESKRAAENAEMGVLS